MSTWRGPLACRAETRLGACLWSDVSSKASVERVSTRQAGAPRYVLLLVLLLAGCANRLPARGMILSVDPSAHTVLVSHRDIPHYMPAMTMKFPVRKPADLSSLYPGAQVEFKLVARKSGS